MYFYYFNNFQRILKIQEKLTFNLSVEKYLQLVCIHAHVCMSNISNQLHAQPQKILKLEMRSREWDEMKNLPNKLHTPIYACKKAFIKF